MIPRVVFYPMILNLSQFAKFLLLKVGTMHRFLGLGHGHLNREAIFNSPQEAKKHGGHTDVRLDLLAERQA